ncbi:cell wall hydrolase [Parasphingorhabdus sp. JC815]|uniref:cell wall hydrolase n=1 Tax=Parasphingorhabdus sp. JC815 TaxID=3232140 RepID=UPI00345B3DC6
MRVPPPYVPKLGNGGPAIPGPAGYVIAPSPDTPSRDAPYFDAAPWGNGPTIATTIKREASITGWRMPHGLALNARERILLCLLVLSLTLTVIITPQASLDAHQYVPSDPALQPVERPEENFAGSAFYFLAPDYAISQDFSENAQAASAPMLAPAVFQGSATDNSRAMQCLTSAIYYEAGLEPDAGQQAVAQVVLNRVRHPSYPATVCGVVFQGSERVTGCQFSYTCDGSMRRTPSLFHWKRAQKVAAMALSGKSISPVGTATHYHTTEIHPYWAKSLRFLGTIGAHRFYSWQGSAGKASAFNQIYRGGEPLPGPNPRVHNLASAPSLDPIALEKAYEAGRRKAAVKARAAEAMAADNARRHGLPAPSRSDQALSYNRETKHHSSEKSFTEQHLPDDSRIKPEYRNSGTWKVKPAGG